MRWILVLLLLSAVAVVLAVDGSLSGKWTAAGPDASVEIELTSNEPAGEANDPIESEDPSEDDVVWHGRPVSGGGASTPLVRRALPLLHARLPEPVHPPPRV